MWCVRLLICFAAIALSALVHAGAARYNNNSAPQDENVIVDDGGSLKMMPSTSAPQPYARQPYTSPSAGPRQPQNQPQRGVRAGDSTSVAIPPASSGAGYGSEDQRAQEKSRMMDQYNQIKSQLPPELQNLSPEEVEQEFKKRNSGQ